jgi:ribonucleotide monophosphatase NagD (HAD superfamily)
MVNMIEFNTGRAPEVVVGKPNPLMLTVLTKAAHLDPARRYQGLLVLLFVVAVAVAVVVGAVVAVCSFVVPLVLSGGRRASPNSCNMSPWVCARLLPVGCPPFSFPISVMVGDRLDTDIQFGHGAGVPTVLVLTGVSTIDEVRPMGSSPSD